MPNDNSNPYDMIPQHMHHGMRMYIEHGVLPGGFLTSVLCNDLREAVSRADSVNIEYLVAYIRFLTMHAPASCWGSPEKVKEWRRTGGLTAERKRQMDLAFYNDALAASDHFNNVLATKDV